MKIRIIGLCAIFIAIMLAGCNKKEEKPENHTTTNAIYHWKTVFNPTAEELDFMKRHNVKTLYLKMFDVVLEEDAASGSRNVVPAATTQFKAQIPEGVEVIPTAYITLEALRNMEWAPGYYANLIVERMLAMARYNKCGNIKEIQLDCDWTDMTEEIYDTLCSRVKANLKKDSINLSVTLRLHQLNKKEPVADRTVLMLYNTGALKDPDTKNSILSIHDVKAYLDRFNGYMLPMDYAYPAFSWGVKFKNGEFQSIISNPDSAKLEKGETIRREDSDIDVILKTKRLVEEKLGRPYRSNIIYHLDNKSLKKYTHEEIGNIYSSN